MLVIATLVYGFRGPASGLPAFLMFGIVFVRHLPNIREILGR
jgi:hypothetical protein